MITLSFENPFRCGCASAAFLIGIALGVPCAAAESSSADSFPDSAGASDPQPPASTEYSTDAVETDTAEWEFSVTPYVWFSGFKGEVGVFPSVQPVDVDLSFGDVFDHLKFAGMATLQARRDRFVAIADITYVDLGASKDIGIRDPEFADVDLDTSNFSTTIAAGYRVVDQGPLFFDLMGGVRVSAVDTRLRLIGPRRTIEANSSETWVDPIFAARFRAPVSDRLSLALYGDVGGFGVSSDVTWQLLGTLQYEISPNWRVSGGWRHYATDYNNSDFIYDVSMSGPIIGFSYLF